MGFDDRLIWLLLGVAIGFFMGYLTRTLREIKEETHEVNVILKEQHPSKENEPRQQDEGGRINPKFLNGLAIFLVVVLCAFASFKSQRASNELESTQEQLVQTQKRLDKVVDCNADTLTNLLDAINTRTAFTRSAASSNLKLQKDQATMFRILFHIPPYTDKVREAALQDYIKSLGQFVVAGTQSETNAVTTPYPEAVDLYSCIDKLTEEPKE